MEDETIVPAEKKSKGGWPKGKKREAKAAAPKIDLIAALDTPEGKKLFKEAIAAALANQAAPAPEAPRTDAETMMRALAHEISAINDQGMNVTKKLSSAEITRRADAQKRMYELLADVRELDEDRWPKYELSRAIYLDEQYIDPTYADNTHVLRRTQISWPGIPNEAMSPINETAREIYRAFIVSIGGQTPHVKQDVDPLKTERKSNLSVLHKADDKTVPQVGGPRRVQNEMRVLRKNDPDQVIETRVLGTVADPARQLA